MNSKFSDYEHSLYKLLFDEFQKENYHYEFSVSADPQVHAALVSALEHMQAEDVLFILNNDESGICVELDPEYCFSFIEI